MARDLIRIIYDAQTKISNRIIIPDEDCQLDSVHTPHEGENHVDVTRDFYNVNLCRVDGLPDLNLLNEFLQNLDD